MRKFFFNLTAAACAVSFATEAQAQYGPYAAPQARMQSPLPTSVTPGRYTPAAQAAGYHASGATYGVQPVSVAMRPGTTTYAAAPAAGGLRPVNPPSAQTQRLLLASRTTPTPAPAQVSQAAPRPAAPAGPPQQYWNSSVNSLPWDQSNGASYGAPAPQPDPNLGGPGPGAGPVAGPYAGGGGECCNTGGGCAPACGGCCCGLGRHCCLRTTGDLVQHMPHFGTTHGYYYFRPYHVMHVFSQQELATRWGGDPRNPYDNTMFQQIYQQMGVDAATQKAREAANAKANAIQNTPPAVQEYIVPTPVPNYQQGPQPYPQGAQPYPQAPQPYPSGAPQFVPGSEVPQGALPPGVVPQGIVPGPTPGPAVEYVPNVPNK